jgi:DNA repair protein RAD51
LEDDLDDLIEECIRLTGPRVVNGNEAYEEGKGKSPIGRFEGWGLPRLDHVLNEWDGVGIVEIAGPRRVGKSVSLQHRVYLKALIIS